MLSELSEPYEYSEVSMRGGILSRKQCRRVLSYPDSRILALLDAAYRVRHHYRGATAHIQVLANAKSGYCSEDCHYCSQSCLSSAEIEKYPLVSQESLLQEAKHAKETGAKRFCMALSGHKPTAGEIGKLCGIIREIKAEIRISLCCSLGHVDAEQARQLRAAGLDRVNHNLNTSERFYEKICTTHTFQDRLDTIQRCREAGLEVCSGGIVGQGESDDDIIDMLLLLRELQPESLPINFLIPIKGTPLGEHDTGLTPYRCLKVLCLARFLNPEADLRVAGGREYHLRSLQPLALYPANSIFVSGYLTTGGQPAEEAIQMIADLGFTLEIEGVGASNTISTASR
ncbi:MAG: biotin synthase BioB [Planctomycetes bacterium]|nr:biotin synthase BioB [Planctomycetota bacterium]